MPGDARAPRWLPAAVATVRHLPFGRYWLLHRLRRFLRQPFTATLSPALGALRFECDPRDTVASEACFTGWYEPQETQIVARTLAPGAVFVDVGANWGYFSLVAGHLAGAGGRVIALEPEPRLFALLRANVALNGLGRVTPRQVAAAAEPGQMAFRSFDPESDNWGTSHAAGAGDAADFHCATAALDDLLDAEGVGDVDLVKIDVEGGEIDVLQGMGRGLARGRYRHVLLECHPAMLEARGSSAEASLARLLDAGYRLWVVDHSAAMHRRAARASVAIADLMRAWEPGVSLGPWPHVFAAAPGAPGPGRAR